ncbi:hypothetical protein BU23DRAFT_572645 [Bimuria novae-zelandiae CBS 107.79]|uniref:Uncharacterized protein n=1 Tax=Bimuria novae-zelandiae CBS 107.79 TaxID=1447943 RepID=A0A6A5UTH7_9PLEO|nr:hypothetical protein BU23DRAFT_572645 [Bimuria novae-zelandiae CBS 107.79]
MGIDFEHHTSHPSVGQILLYPGGYSETELLFCYGGVSFDSKMGPLAANQFLTIIEGNENLKALGELVLWKGAQDVLFEIADKERPIRLLVGQHAPVPCGILHEIEKSLYGRIITVQYLCMFHLGCLRKD